MAGACDRMKLAFVFYLIINLFNISSNAFENNFRFKRQTGSQYTSIPDNVVNSTIQPTIPYLKQDQQVPQSISISTSLGTSTSNLKQQSKETSVLSSVQANLNNTSDKIIANVNNNTFSTNIAFTPQTNYTSSSINRPLLGVNGTGQRKDFTPFQTPIVSDPITAVPSTENNSLKKVVLTSPQDEVIIPSSLTPSLNNFDDIFDTIDVPENKTREFITNQNLTFKEENHIYYYSQQSIDENLVNESWNILKQIPPNQMLSTSHRRAITVQLKFDFPFYGNAVRNITVATGGFLYTGEYVHSWLAATQYIAPLMANFDTSLSNESFVRYDDNGTSFSVLWENVSLQDKSDAGKFTFSVTLYDTGDIKFIYYRMPISIGAIQDDKHPVKVGLSDAYIIDKVIFFARRKTIYEYHRVSFNEQDIRNNTIIYLKALPTCLNYTDCESCMNHNTTFTCYWCPALNKCSTGTDRKRHDWIVKGCERSVVKDIGSCPARGSKGNDATSSIEINNGSGSQENNNSSRYDTLNRNTDDMQQKKLVNENSLPMAAADSTSNSTNNIGLAIGLMIPICLVMTLLIWILYAYRNPHTKSGQFLIQYRPTQWSWRRGEARYTAATIHM